MWAGGRTAVKENVANAFLDSRNDMLVGFVVAEGVVIRGKGMQ